LHLGDHVEGDLVRLDRRGRRLLAGEDLPRLRA
ncbi:MAG: hypothetical protein JWO14_2459, partial [Solirubrobacterales bacterium]|nr:hypothetical protein [Solirubrobacterales bacterium]